MTKTVNPASNIIIFISLFPISCNNKTDKQYNLYNHEILTRESKIVYDSLDYDTLFISLPTTSFVGEFYMHKNKIYFADKIFCLVDELSLDGEFIAQHLGLGQGPNEVPRLRTFFPTDQFYMVTHDWNFYIYNLDWQLKDKFVLQWISNSSVEDLRKNPEAENIKMYELEYLTHKIRFDSISHEFILPINTEHPKFNAFISRNYYNKSHLLASVDITTGIVNEIFGRFSTAYENYNYVPFHAFSYFDFTGNNYYLSFEVDSLIYVFDKNFKATVAFGAKGTGVSESYSETNYLQAFDDMTLFDKARNNDGYYQQVDVIEKQHVIFRKYQKRGGEKRLQIYKDYSLIGDVPISGEFKILGYYNKFYYCQGLVDEQNEKMAIFKFQLLQN